MKKLWVFLTTVVPREGVYFPYSWHAPLNEAAAEEAAKAARMAAAASTGRNKIMHPNRQNTAWV
jgi:hypothetical protein